VSGRLSQGRPLAVDMGLSLLERRGHGDSWMVQRSGYLGPPEAVDLQQCLAPRRGEQAAGALAASSLHTVRGRARQQCHRTHQEPPPPPPPPPPEEPPEELKPLEPETAGGDAVRLSAEDEKRPMWKLKRAGE
jgi:hypothetical protein